MPLYNYRCNKCGTEFFEICSFKVRNNQPCSECQSPDVKKLLTSAHFVLDGKMQTLHSNSPDGQARASETRKKHIKNHTHKLFKEENKERAKRDGKWTYN